MIDPLTRTGKPHILRRAAYLTAAPDKHGLAPALDLQVPTSVPRYCPRPPMTTDRLNQLLGHIRTLALGIPGENAPTEPWQAQVVAAVDELVDAQGTTLSAPVQMMVPVGKVAALKDSLRVLRERAGRYAPSNDSAIREAFDEIVEILQVALGAMPTSHNPPLGMDQRVLDFVADYELRRGKATPVLEVQLEFPDLDDALVVAALENLERRKLVQLGGSNRNEVYLKRLGVLKCTSAGTWNELGTRLLSYLRHRLLKERGDFKEYTWKALHDAGVAMSDADRVAIERLITIFSLSPHSSGGGWHVPPFIVKLRAIHDLEQLDTYLVALWETPPQGRPPPPRREQLQEDMTQLATMLLSQIHDRGGDLSVPFGSVDLAAALGWDPAQFNRSMNALARRGWLDLDPNGGSVPFDAHGFEVTEDGLLAFEAALDSSPRSSETENVNDAGRKARTSAPRPDPKSVFVIHGRNMPAKDEMGIFLRACGLKPINFGDLRAELGGTPTIDRIVEEGMARAQGVVALFTADEYASLRPSFIGPVDHGAQIERWQARPNVIFEAGMAFGKDRDRVVFVLLGNPHLFTDVAGVHVLRPTNDVHGDRAVLRDTLRKGMRCGVEDSSDWMKAGDFDRCVQFPTEVSPRNSFELPKSESSAAVMDLPEQDARICLVGWLNELPVVHSGKALRFEAIAADVGIPSVQVKKLLSGVVQSSGSGWSVAHEGETVVILVCKGPEPASPRSFSGFVT